MIRYFLVACTMAVAVSCTREESDLVDYTPIATGTDVNLYAITSQSSGVMWICGGIDEFGLLLRSVDGGDTWSLVADDFGQPLHGIYFVSASTGFAAGARAEVFKTSDGGNTWQKLWINVPAFPVEFRKPFRSISGVGDTVFFAGGAGYDAGVIVRTTDAGTSWSVHTFSQELRGICFFNAQEGVACGFGVMYRTRDGGDTWQPVTAPDDFFTSLEKDAEGRLWASGFDGGIYRSDDRGGSWSTLEQNNGLVGGRRHYNALHTMNPLLVTIGTGGAIGFSRDGGMSWLNEKSFGGASLKALVLLPDGSGLACGNEGALFRFRLKN